ncbi:MAG: 2Fe-2S iron-sulfur cluster binding domain-containing protein [Planctomycetes bacterium]|nr:2Fe-2S iron-sulfur cluster binding domain-containing protein [Planctomycetota bacterium]
MGHRVFFRSADRIAEAIEGETLLDTARRSGVHLDSSCGGNGSCHQCRVALPVCRDHDVNGNPANFHDRAGNSLAPQHSRNHEPIWLACRGIVRGELVVDAAPVHALADKPRAQTLEGWQVESAAGAALVFAGDPLRGACYDVQADGRIARVMPYATHGMPDAFGVRKCRVGTDISHAAALALSVSHLGMEPCVILDVSGVAALVNDGVITWRAVMTRPLLGDVPHVAGAIDSVEWSPLKTRTVLSTVDNAAPIGMSTTGLLAGIAALLQAGMCNADWQLIPSRFTGEFQGSLRALLVGPGAEAVTPGGSILTATRDMALTQTMLDACREAIHALRTCGEELAGAPCRAVLTGDYGVSVSSGIAKALGFWSGDLIGLPHAAALGAARAAMMPGLADSVSERTSRHRPAG